MKDILSRATFAGKVLCLVVFIGVAQACGLSAFAAMSAAFLEQFRATPAARALPRQELLTADADAETSP